MPSIRQELAEKRAKIIEAAQQRGPKQANKSAIAAAQKARRERTPTKRSAGGGRPNKSDLIKKNAGAHSLPGVVVSR